MDTSATDDNIAISFGPQIEMDPELAAADPSKYIEGDGQVIVDIWNSLAGVVVTIDLRLLLPDGTVVPNQWVLSPTADRTKNMTTATVSEGFVLSCTARAPSGTSPGATYVRVSITRGSPVSGMKSTILAAGYVGNQNELSYPNGSIRQTNDGGGRIRSITGTTPAAGAESVETVPTGCFWSVMAYRVVLTTSATVGNRFFGLIVDDGVNTLLAHSIGGTIVANNVIQFMFGPGYQNVANNVLFYSFFPTPLKLTAGMRIRTNSVSLLGNDQYSAPQYLVEEWIAP